MHSPWCRSSHTSLRCTCLLLKLKYRLFHCIVYDGAIRWIEHRTYFTRFKWWCFKASQFRNNSNIPFIIHWLALFILCSTTFHASNFIFMRACALLVRFEIEIANYSWATSDARWNDRCICNCIRESKSAWEPFVLRPRLETINSILYWFLEWINYECSLFFCALDVFLMAMNCMHSIFWFFSEI